MKKLIVVLFILIGLLIAFFAVKEYWEFSPEKAPIQSRNLSSEIFGSEEVADKSSGSVVDEIDVTSLISLLPGENLIGAHFVDFNKDNSEDQIIAVTGAGIPVVRIIIGLYNPLLGIYERSYVLTTEIEQARTFSFTVMDITGTHENALIITGYSNNNESMLQAWQQKKEADNFELELIADLKAEGIIFVQESNRTASYAFSTTDGNSFPILAYTSDPAAGEGSLAQLHIIYDWDKDEQKYVEKTRTRIAGKVINAQELAKIQDGTEKTFSSFLNGLWAKPADFIENTSYLFFDYAEKEIIFLHEGAAEIYLWERSILRRNGILIFTTNTTIPNLSRKVDISLISVDEIRIKVTDDLDMIISHASAWDGNYKKQSINVAYTTTPTGNTKRENFNIEKLLQTSEHTIWECDNGYYLNFSESTYAANNATTHEIGIFTTFEVHGENILQFRSQFAGSSFTGFYRSEIIDTEASNESLVGTRIILSPIKVGASGIDTAVDKTLTLELISTD